MVLKAILVLILLASFFNTSPVFAWTTVSGLVQYGNSVNRDRLKLLENSQQIKLTGSNRYSVTGTYVIYNRGEVYTATFGLLFNQWQGESPSPACFGLQFFVDGNMVNYTEITKEIGLVNMDGKERRLLQSSTSWALISVSFPPASIVTITVKYINLLTTHAPGSNRGAFLAYNPQGLSYFPGLFHWGGNTRFSVEIVNMHIPFETNINVEQHWVTDIIFEHVDNYRPVFGNIDDFINWYHGIAFQSLSSTSQNILRTSEYLVNLQTLETDLMRIQRPNANTIRIDFTEKFLDNYFRSFVIDFNHWGNLPRAYVRLENEALNLGIKGASSEILLDFLESNSNISQRILAPYELIFLTGNQLRVIRNTFFARHGFIFISRELQDVFTMLGMFYQPNPNFHEGMLTVIDHANIAVIQRLEVLVRD